MDRSKECKGKGEYASWHLNDWEICGKEVATLLHISFLYLFYVIVMLYDWCYYVLCNQNGDHYAFFRLVSYLIVCWGPWITIFRIFSVDWHWLNLEVSIGIYFSPFDCIWHMVHRYRVSQKKVPTLFWLYSWLPELVQRSILPFFKGE